VDEVDSAAVSLLLEWARQAVQRGRQLQLRNLPENLQCLLKVYDVQELLPAA
jgi:phospholipid transport system transporter-binding protein